MRPERKGMDTSKVYKITHGSEIMKQVELLTTNSSAKIWTCSLVKRRTGTKFCYFTRSIIENNRGQYTIFLFSAQQPAVGSFAGWEWSSWPWQQSDRMSNDFNLFSKSSEISHREPGTQQVRFNKIVCWQHISWSRITYNNASIEISMSDYIMSLKIIQWPCTGVYV